MEEKVNFIPGMIEGVETHLYDVLNNVNADDLLLKIKWPTIDNKDSKYLSKIELVQDITLSVYNLSFKPNLAAILEQSYRDVLVFPLLKACINIIGNDSSLFVPGEVPLEGMTIQLANLKRTLASDEKYYADGVESYQNNDIWIHEASGCFGAKDKSKHNFDFHKALFGLLSSLATVADTYKYASLKPFQNSSFILFKQKVHP